MHYIIRLSTGSHFERKLITLLSGIQTEIAHLLATLSRFLWPRRSVLSCHVENINSLLRSCFFFWGGGVGVL